MKPRSYVFTLGTCLSLLFFAGCAAESTGPESNTVAAPVLSPQAGTYSTALDVAITTATAEATIRYTTDGTTPTTTSGTVYAGPVHVAETTTIQAVAYRSGWTTSAVTSAHYVIAPLVAAPSFSPGPGSYTDPQDVAITTLTPEASIRYTTDGTTPTDTLGTLYTGAVHIASSLTLKAVAYKAGFTTSYVTSGVYEVGPLVAAPAFNPGPGTYLDPQDVAITTATPEASIRYTTDGTVPTDTAGTLYTGPVHIADSLTLRAVAFRAGWRTSAVTSGAYTIGDHVGAPQFTPPAGTYTSEQNIAITTTTAGAAIRYTTDGTIPTDTVGTLYTAPVHLTQSVTLKAVAYKTGLITSLVTSGDYSIGSTVTAPKFSVPAGTYATAFDVTITTVTSGASIRYTMDGTTPTASAGTLSSGPVRVARPLTLKAVAYKTGFTTSGVTSAVYKRAGVAAGAIHTMAVLADGSIWAWGGNTEGQIGNGTTTPRQTPAAVPGITAAADVAAGSYHSVALLGDGTVRAWGRNFYGQLGDGTTTQRLSPVAVQGIAGAEAVACGENSTYALLDDGTVWAWGLNSEGQLGDGSETDRRLPVQVLGLSGITAIAAGQQHAVAIKSDGTVWAWGYNAYGSLGDGTTTSRTSPVQVPSLSGITAIAANGYHTAAVRDDGTLWTWGSGSFGELGTGDQPAVSPTPAQADGLAGVAAAGAGAHHTLALIDDGTLWACGYNLYGQLGDGTNTDRSVAVEVQGISAVLDAAGGLDHTVAFTGDGSVWAWGHNLNFQVGDGTTTDRSLPVQVLH